MKGKKYSKSRIERSCGMCGYRGDRDDINTIKVGDLYRIIRHHNGEAWPICYKCDNS